MEIDLNILEQIINSRGDKPIDGEITIIKNDNLVFADYVIAMYYVKELKGNPFRTITENEYKPYELQKNRDKKIKELLNEL